MKVTDAENKIMDILWKRKTAFMKDILEDYPEPKLAKTTIATMLKRMNDKKIIAYKTYGNSRAYYPLVKKEDYFKQEFSGFIHRFFGNSVSQFASYFTSNSQLSQEELKALRDLIDQKIEK